VTGVVSAILAVVLAGVSVAWLWVSASEGAVLGPAIASLLVAILSALIAVLAFQVAGRPSGAVALVGPLQLFTILTVGIGFAGAVLGIALGGITGSIVAIGAGIEVFVTSFIVAIQGMLVYGAAKHSVGL
jgi:hypothetical protein